MKIVCDNCATKYSIADEKVRGKVFKIRCKKCSHIIVVRGGESGAPQEAPGASDGAFPGDDGATLAARGQGAPAALGAGDAVWHLVVDREQIGPLTPQEVRAKFAAGEVDVETYAWREGFADWLRLGSIEDFRDLNAAAPAAAAHAAPAAEEGATRRTDTADLFASSSAADDGGGDGASDLFGGGAAPAPAAAPMAAAPAQAFSSGGGANLFGAPEEQAQQPVASRPARTSSPGFAPQAAAANGGGGAAAAASSDAASRMTGQRNENSVLFSLNNLQALASGGGGGAAAAPKPGVDTRPGFANSQTEGSGLIDIRAMAASTLAASPATGGSAKSDEPVNFSAAPIFSPMAAPILMPAAPTGPPKWMWAILGLGVLAVVSIVTVGILLLTRKPAEPVVAANLPSPTGNPPAGLAPTGTAPTGTAPTGTAPTGTAPTGTAPTGTAPTGDKPVLKADEPSHDRKHGSKSGDKAAKPDKGTKVAKAESSPVSAPAAAPAAEPKRKKGGDALDDLLNQASPEKASAPKKAAREEPSGGGDDANLPEQLSRGDIQGGMSKVRGKVDGCYGQYHVPGLASVQVTIGKSGRVSNANVTGTFAGTPTGSCLEKAVKGASFPQFKGSPMTITYPYVLR